MSLAERIAHRRKQLRLSKRALGRKIGVSDVAILYWESGETKQIGHQRLLALAGALETTVSELLDDPGLLDYKAEIYSDAASVIHIDAASKPHADKLYEVARGLHLLAKDAKNGRR